MAEKHYPLFNCLALIMLAALNLPLHAQTGIFTVNGDLTIGSGTIEIELNNTSGPGTGHDQIVNTGDLNIDGTLSIVLDGYTPTDNDQFEIMDFGGVLSGSFSNILWPESMSNWAIDYGVLNPGKVTIYAPESALPIELVYFRGKQDGDDNLLTWRTANELNNAYFEIELSHDGKIFTNVDKVSGAGNSSNLKDYSYRHKVSLNRVYYYRLKQVDYDGGHSFSNIVSIHRTTLNDILIYPNPSRGIIYFSEQVDEIIFINTMGQPILSKTEVGKQIDVSDLPSGQYYLSINGSTEKTPITILNK